LFEGSRRGGTGTCVVVLAGSLI